MPIQTAAVRFLDGREEGIPLPAFSLRVGEVCWYVPRVPPHVLWLPAGKPGRLVPTEEPGARKVRIARIDRSNPLVLDGCAATYTLAVP